MPRVLVAEPSAPIAASLRLFLTGVAEVEHATSLDQAIAALQRTVPEVLIARVSGQLDGEILCAQVRAARVPSSVVLIYHPDETRGAERSESAKANGYLVSPLKKPAVVNAVKSVLRLRESTLRVVSLEAELDRLKASGSRTTSLTQMPKLAVAETDDAFFKKFMLLEVKRSRRYQYPSALFIAAPDELNARLNAADDPEAERQAVLGEAYITLGELLRDIDVVRPFGGDRLMAFLPHTPRAGALVVAKRAIAKLSRSKVSPGLTFSIGVATFDPKVAPKAPISFGALVREATLAVKAAVAAGGNRIEAAPGAVAPKRDRMGLG